MTLPVRAFQPLRPLDREFQGGLLIFGPDALTAEQMARLEEMAAYIIPALANADEHHQVLNQYRMVETIRQTWDQLWITRDEQQRALEKMVARNRALHTIGLTINSSLNLREVLNAIVRETVNLAQASRGAIAMWDEARRELTVMAEHNLGLLGRRYRPGFSRWEDGLDRRVFNHPGEPGESPAFRPPIYFPPGLLPGCF